MAAAQRKTTGNKVKKSTQNAKSDKKSSPKDPNQITPQQQLFADEYLISLNVTQSMLSAGYEYSYANSQGYKLLGNVGIQAYIQKKRDRVQNKLDITLERILNEYATIGFFDIGDLFDEDGKMKPLHEMSEQARRAIAGIESFDEIEQAGEETFKSGVVRKIKVADKRAALDSMCKVLGLNAPDRTDITTNGESLNPEDLSKLSSTEKIQLLRLKQKMRA